MPSTDEVPVSCGEPLTQRPVTWARSARRLSSSALKLSGTSASTAPRMSIVPDAGDRLRAGEAARVRALERDRQAGDPQLAEAAGGGRGLRGRRAGGRLQVGRRRQQAAGDRQRRRGQVAAGGGRLAGGLALVRGDRLGPGRRAEGGGEGARLAGPALRGGGRGNGGEQGEAEQAEGGSARRRPAEAGIRHPRLVPRRGAFSRPVASRAARGGCRGRTRTSGPGRAGPRRGGWPRP